MARRTNNDMRKIYLILAIAGIMMTTACSNENNEPVITTDEANVTFTVNLDDIDSRVISDGNTVDQLVFAVFDTNGNEVTALRQNNVPVSNCHATVTSRVQLGRGFTFVFWAQKSGNTFYNTTNLKDVVVSYDGYANDENRDAFTASWSIEKVTQDFTKDVTLYRPFAQINYVCDVDDWEKVLNSTYGLNGSDFTVAAGAFTHLNLLTGEASQPTAVSLARPQDNSFVSTTTKVSTSQYQHQGLFDNEKYWISMNYILAQKDVQTSLTDATMKIYSTGQNDQLVENVIGPIELPIQRNHRTVVYIQDLTKVVKLEVIIDPSFPHGDF